MRSRRPYFEVYTYKTKPRSNGGSGGGRVIWNVRFKGANHRKVFYAYGYNTRRAALDAIALIDPTGQHPVVER